MDDPHPENSIAEVKVTPANAGKADMQPKAGVSTFMDVDEAGEANGAAANAAAAGGAAAAAAAGGVAEVKTEEKEADGDDNVTEQTHHIIVPSYR